MNHLLDKLEISVYQLAQKFETVAGENKRLKEEIAFLKQENEREKREHQAATDELSEALLVQVARLKEDLQGKIDALHAEKEELRAVLTEEKEQLRETLTREKEALRETLTRQNDHYRNALGTQAEQVRRLIQRLPQPQNNQQEKA